MCSTWAKKECNKEGKLKIINIKVNVLFYLDMYFINWRKKKQYSIGRYLHIINRIYFIKLKPNFISTFLKAKMLSNAIHDTLMFNIF